MLVAKSPRAIPSLLGHKRIAHYWPLPYESMNKTVMTFDAARRREDQSKAKVFISYSRKDIDFADRLDAALKTRGFEPLIDRTEIYAFEEWWKRIEDLIARADTVIFVLSPDAVRPGSVALKEVGFAASLNKRFAPIVFRPVEDKDVPEALAKLNFIFFDDVARFEQSAGQLAEALDTDISWIRQHTEFGEQARRWALAKSASGLLLRSPLLEEAERWVASRPESAPPPTEETRAFIAQSRLAATRRRNLLTATLGVGLVLALGLAGLAYWQRGVAVEQERIAEQQRAAAVEQRDRALLTQSRFLADLANQRTRDSDYAGTTLIFAVCPRWASAHLRTQMPRRAAVHALTTWLERPHQLGW
jgi:nucleoside 2-deoxyribosyltransferase